MRTSPDPSATTPTVWKSARLRAYRLQIPPRQRSASQPYAAASPPGRRQMHRGSTSGAPLQPMAELEWRRRKARIGQQKILGGTTRYISEGADTLRCRIVNHGTITVRNMRIASLQRRRAQRPKRVHGQLKTQTSTTLRCTPTEFRCQQLARAEATTTARTEHRELLKSLGTGPSIGRGRWKVDSGGTLHHLARRAQRQPAESPGTLLLAQVALPVSLAARC